jgi:hypothetical protein
MIFANTDIDKIAKILNVVLIEEGFTDGAIDDDRN